MEQLKNFNMIDLGDKLRLSDNDFDAWLEELGLLHGKRTCEACGGSNFWYVKQFLVSCFSLLSCRRKVNKFFS